MSKIRPWLFRILILGAVGMWLYAWFQWWWQAYVVELNDYLYIRPWGLFGNVGEMQALIEDAFLPGWFPILMWGVLTVLLILFLLTLVFSFQPNKEISLLGRLRMSKATFFTTVTGLALIVVMTISIVMMIINMKEWYDTPLQGQMFIDFGEHYNSDVITKLLPGYWIAWATGPVVLVLAVLRRFIVGKS